MFYRIANIIGGGIPTLASDSLFAYRKLGQHMGDRISGIGLYLDRLGALSSVGSSKPADDKVFLEVHGKQVSVAEVVREFFATFRAFFSKKTLVSRWPSFCCSA